MSEGDSETTRVRTSLTTRSCVLTLVPSSSACWVKSISGTGMRSVVIFAIARCICSCFVVDAIVGVYP
jgi:hypothetical protein